MNRAYYNRTVSIQNFETTLQEFMIHGIWKLYIEIIDVWSWFYEFIFGFVDYRVYFSLVRYLWVITFDNYDYIALFEIMGFCEEGVGHIGVGLLRFQLFPKNKVNFLFEKSSYKIN